jgi:hypothetical protein
MYMSLPMMKDLYNQVCVGGGDSVPYWRAAAISWRMLSRVAPRRALSHCLAASRGSSWRRFLNNAFRACARSARAFRALPLPRRACTLCLLCHHCTYRSLPGGCLHPLLLVRLWGWRRRKKREEKKEGKRSYMVQFCVAPGGTEDGRMTWRRSTREGRCSVLGSALARI